MKDDNNNRPDIKTRFQPGQSGNPEGGAAFYTKVRKANYNSTQVFRDHLPTVVDVLLSIILDRKVAAGTRVAAIKEFHNRALGAARNYVTTVHKNADDEDEAFDTTGMSDEALKALQLALKAAPITIGDNITSLPVASKTRKD